MKKCKNCGEEKEYVEFYKRKNGKLLSCCKICTNIKNRELKKLNKEKIEIQQKEYRKENKDKKKIYNNLNKNHISEQRKEYRELNKEHIKEQRKEYRKKNRDKINDYTKKKMSEDPLFKLSQIIVKSKKTVDILGCSFEEFKIYLENKFNGEINWDNHGTYWHLDHIIPSSWAKNEEEVYKLNHYTNFQPLRAFDNLSKNNRFAG